MITEQDIAWAAGIIDGEGCIFIARKQPGAKRKTRSITYVVGIKVTMGHEPTIARISEIFGSGGRFTVDQTKKHYNLAYTWLAQAKQVRSVLEKIRPHCTTKGREIDVAFEFLDLPGWFGGQFRGPKSPEYQAREYELWDKMRRLKPRTRLKLEREEAWTKQQPRRS